MATKGGGKKPQFDIWEGHAAAAVFFGLSAAEALELFSPKENAWYSSPAIEDWDDVLERVSALIKKGATMPSPFTSGEL